MRRVPRHDSFRLTGQRDTDTTPRLELSVQLRAASSPTTPAARAKFVPDAAGSYGDTDRHSPTNTPTCHRRSDDHSCWWRVKDSNLGRHQPTDLQTAAVQPERSRILNSPCAPIVTRPAHADDHRQVPSHRAVCGPSQPTEQHSTTRCDADQQQVLPLVSARLTAVIRRPAWSPRRSCQSQRPVPSPGGQVSGMASLQRKCRTGWGWGWAGCGVSSTSLKGYHTPACGQSGMAHAPVPSRATPRLACGRAMPGRGDATRSPACEIVGGRAELMIVWTLYGHKTHPDNPK